jgi:hypothetical protein
MAKPNRMVMVSLVVVVVLIAGVTASLLISHHDTNASSTSTSQTTTTSASGTSTSSPAGTTTTLPVDNLHFNARDQVTPTSCVHTNNAWTSEGIVVNPKSYPERVQVVLNFVDSGATVIAIKVVTVPRLAPSASYHWSVTGASGATNLRCIVQFAQAHQVS